MENYEQLMKGMRDALEGLEPGSEEYLNQTKAMKEIASANAEDVKAANETRKTKVDEFFKKFERVAIIGTAVGTLLTGIGKVLEPILRRNSNKDWVKAEDEGFYIKNKDNK